MTVYALIPAFNEGRTVGEVVQGAAAHVAH